MPRQDPEGPREWSPRADLRRRLDQALQKADAAFWAEIAKAFPEVKSGDFPPDLTARWTKDIGDAVLQWMLTNHPNARAIERYISDVEEPRG